MESPSSEIALKEKKIGGDNDRDGFRASENNKKDSNHD